MRSNFLLLLALLVLTGCSAPQTAPKTAEAVSQTVVAEPATLPPPSPTAESSGCSNVSDGPTATPATFMPAISEADYVFGPANAPVTFIEYCDFQAPICRSMAAVMGNIARSHPEQVRLVFRPVPISGQLDKSELAVQAAIAAGEQGKFWEMYDALFVRSNEWDTLTPAQFEGWAAEQAAGLGLDETRFQMEMKSQETATRMKSMFNSARESGLQAVPLLLITGSPQPAFSLDYNSIEATVSLILLAERQFKTCPPISIDPSRQYLATLHTEKGDVTLELYADKSPIAVNSFVFLARAGWFDGVTFHRVIPGFVAQTGDPTGTGRGNPGYLFKNENDPSLQFDAPGLLAMANSGPDTNGSQFFITYAPQPSLNGAYTIFGRVLSGMDVLESLTARDPATYANLPPGDKILSVEIVEK
jgi:cyclophilin family peptidyl-prolyl cis-trans isomerase/protein-disulfide isomerase